MSNSWVFIQSATIRQSAAFDQVEERDGLHGLIRLVGFAAGSKSFGFVHIESPAFDLQIHGEQ